MPASQTIVVTGATGFLGADCVAALAQDHRIVATGRNPTRLASLRHGGVATQQLDLTAGDAAARLAEHQPDVIVHTAALSSPWGRREHFEAANIAATQAVVQACVSAKASLVHISTPAIYMNGGDRLLIGEEAPLPETFINDYAATKRVAEQLVLVSDVSAAILRPQAIIGAGDTSVAPRFERVASRGVFPLVRGCDPVLDMTHVRNVVAAVETCCDRLFAKTWKGSEIFNITNGDPRPVSELAAAFLTAREAATAGRSVRNVQVPVRLMRAMAALAECAAGNRREPAITRYSVELISTSRTLNIDKARSLLNYDPSAHTIEQAFAEYFASRAP